MRIVGPGAPGEAMSERQHHWTGVYAEKSPDSVSWYQPTPAQSLALIERAVPDREVRIVDVGGGASTLVDHLLDDGYKHVSVLDIADSGLAAAQARLGERAQAVEWIHADVTHWTPTHPFHVWHDRAVFHFLTEAEDRTAYVATMGAALAPGGQAVIATFALHGPEKCSGLPVVGYDAEKLGAELGPGFRLLEELEETHRTPGGGTQAFAYFRFQRSGAA